MIFIYLAQFILGIVIGLLGIYTSEIDILFQIAAYVIFFLYYFIMEATSGVSIGKLICGYTVIDAQAKGPSAGIIAIRSVSRLIPFEAFSCLADRGWHDKFSKTWVVKRSEKARLQQLLGGEISENDILDQASFVVG